MHLLLAVSLVVPGALAHQGHVDPTRVWCNDTVQRALRRARTPTPSVVLLGPGQPSDLACFAQASTGSLHVGLEVPGPGDAEVLDGLRNLRSVAVPHGHPPLTVGSDVRLVPLGGRASVDAGGPPRHHAPEDAGALVRLAESGSLVVGLDLSGADLSEPDLAALAGPPLLEELSLAGLPLGALPAAWPGLAELGLWGAPLRRRDQADLDVRLPDLTRLDLRGTRLAPTLPGVEVLSGPLPSHP